MKIEFFTSMNFSYYNHCGRAMLESFLQLHKKRKIYLYNEDNFDPRLDNVFCMGWDLGYEYRSFQRRWENDNKRVRQFAKKGFSIIHAMNNLDADRIVWLDADSIVKTSFHPQLLELISDKNTLSTHFGVQHQANDKSYFSCETGFFILNKKHKQFDRFKEVYSDIYYNDKYTDLRRFYDGEVYGKTVQILESEGAKMLDLNPGNRHKTPIPRSIIAPYLSHHKAGVKDNLNNEILQQQYGLE